MTRALALPVLAVLLALAALAQLSVGSAVGPLTTLGALFGSGSELELTIVGELRLPRMLVALGTGACLGLGGVVLQAVLRNPLASPEVTGVGSGAVLGAVTATVFGLAGTAGGLTAAAVLGGVLGGAALWLIASRAGTDPLRLVVLGVLVSAVLAGLSLVLLTARPQLAGAAARWLVGSLNGRTWEHWHALWPWLLAVVLLLAMVAPALDLLAVDDDHARGVGLAVTPWRSLALLGAVLATAAAVAAVGAVAFVGLLAPHAARLLAGAEHRLLLPAAGIAGAASVCGADFLAQAVTLLVPASGSQRLGVPVGAVTALAGAVVLIVVARRFSSALAGRDQS
ncbi:FecCD family ABC transporter permease [Crossiella cryophila]|uniref:Iron complex transport system permease protein n=1 Tax=Crossiella cryophila TaxID=43355 RepID=A0A7W7C5W7_9PSEU|nr:iron ABC transporter permease [Crossiella cryophila]MBB4675130.1 iron complex transport system permease protein [Crossiella cryophila]